METLEQIHQNLDRLYRIYMNARERAWQIHDKLSLSKDELEKNELYQKAIRTERRVWAAYVAARGEVD